MLDIHPSAKPPGKVKKLSRRTLSVDQEQHVTRVHENSRMTDDRNDADAHCMKMHGESSGSRHEDGCQVILRKAWRVRPAPSYQCRLSPAPALLNHSRNRLLVGQAGAQHDGNGSRGTRRGRGQVPGGNRTRWNIGRAGNAVDHVQRGRATGSEGHRKHAPLPLTPTCKPLVFESTISFTPFASDWPPIYDDDCLPDPPVFTNPYA